MVEPHEKQMKMQWITVDGRSVPIVLPQIWDYELEDWVVTSTANPIPTQVTGSLVEKGKIIIEHIGNNSLINYPDRYFGENFGAGEGRAIDFGNYNNRAVFIENNHEVSIRVDIFSVMTINNTAGQYSLFNLQDSYISIPSGGTLLITEETHEKLKLPFRYCRLRISNEGTQPTTGSVNFYVFGGN